MTKYVQQFRKELRDKMEVVQMNLTKSHAAQKARYGYNACKFSLEVGDVLMLLPVKRYKMQNSWKGPSEVVKRINEVTCNI